MKLKFSNTRASCLYNYTYHFIRLAACSWWLAAFFLSSCENDEKRIREMTEKKIMTEEATDIDTYVSQHGEMRANLKAPLMIRVMSDTLYTEFPKSLHIDFFGPSANIESWVDAKYGKYYENNNKAYLRDSVIVINNQGDTLKCLDLWWEQDKKIFYTDKYTEYHSKDNNLYCPKGMEATQDLKSITFKDVTGTTQIYENHSPK
jgi:LPS export ABC transporter protein LptC